MAITRLRIATPAALKISRAIELANGDEIGALLRFAPINPNSSSLVLADVFFPVQRAHSSWVEFDDQSVATYYESMSLDHPDIPPHLVRTGWWHHHPFDSSSPSGQDQKVHDDQFGPTNCPDFSVMLITCNDAAKTHCTFRLSNRLIGMDIHLPVVWNWAGINQLPGFEKFDEDLKSIHSKKTWATSNWQSSASGVYSVADDKEAVTGTDNPLVAASASDVKEDSWKGAARYDPEHDCWLSKNGYVVYPKEYRGMKLADYIVKTRVPNTAPIQLAGGTQSVNLAGKAEAVKEAAAKQRQRAFNIKMKSPVSEEDAHSLALKMCQCTPTYNKDWAGTLVDIYNSLHTDCQDRVRKWILDIDPSLLPLEKTLMMWVFSSRAYSAPENFSKLDAHDRQEVLETLASWEIRDAGKRDAHKASKRETQQVSQTDGPSTQSLK